MKKLKEITVLQWAYIVLGGLVVNKLLKAKVAIVAKNSGIVPDAFFIKELTSGIVPDEKQLSVSGDIKTPFTSDLTVKSSPSIVYNSLTIPTEKEFFN